MTIALILTSCISYEHVKGITEIHIEHWRRRQTRSLPEVHLYPRHLPLSRWQHHVVNSAECIKKTMLHPNSTRTVTQVNVMNGFSVLVLSHNLSWRNFYSKSMRQIGTLSFEVFLYCTFFLSYHVSLISFSFLFYYYFFLHWNEIRYIQPIKNNQEG